MNKTIKSILPYGIVSSREHGPAFGAEARIAPRIYNERGELMHVFYLRNSLNAHTPYSMVAGRIPDRILWDRFNEGLPVHFYSHADMFNVSVHDARKFGVLRESESIVPEDYDRLLAHPEAAERFERIFTHSTRILERFSNACFVPAYGVWYGTAQHGGVMRDDAYAHKTKGISVIASNKAITKYHRLRMDLAKRASACPDVDAYGRAFDNYIEHKADALTDYRYSIVVENGIFDNYFTEKILDCFASMTVPIYIGAPNIGDYFNTDGIIVLREDEADRIKDILAGCTQADYESRLDALKDNFAKVQEFLSFEDYILDHYGELFNGQA